MGGQVTFNRQVFATVNGQKVQVPETPYLSATAKYTTTVESVTPHGNFARETIKFDSLMYTTDPGTEQKAAKCSGLTLERDVLNHDSITATDGMALDPAEVTIIRDMFSLAHDDHPPLGDLHYGHVKPVHMGESWDGNNAALALMLTSIMHRTVDASKVSSWVKLNQVVTTAGIPCLDISTHTDVARTKGNLRAKTRAEVDVTVSVEDRNLYPLDPNLPSLDTEFTMTMKMYRTAADGVREVDMQEVRTDSPVVIYK